MVEATYPVGQIILSARERRPAGASPKGIVIALHGGGYDTGYWDFPPTSLLDVGAERGHLAIAVDRPGYGAAFAHPLSLANQAEVIIELARQVRERENNIPLLLAGHSMGGILALVTGTLPQSENIVTAIDVHGVPMRYSQPAQDALDARKLDKGATHFPRLDDKLARASFFGAEEDYSMAALEYDAASRVPVPGAELPDAANAPNTLPAIMQSITMPVRMSFAADEASSLVDDDIAKEAMAHLANASRSIVRYQPNCGHNISLHNIGRDFHHSIIDWLEAV